MIDPNAMPQGGIAGAMPQAGGGMPQEVDPRRPQGQIGGDLLKALAAQKLLKDKQMAERQLAIAQQADANTVVAKNEGELEKRSLDEVSKGVSGVLQNKQRRQQKNLQQLAAKGIATNRRPNMMAMAQGGIVGFQEGQEVEGAEVDAETQNKIIEYVKENPWATALNTAALAALVTPVPGARPLAGVLKLGAMGAKYAPKIAKGVGKLFTKKGPYKPKPGQTVYKNPKTGKMETLDPAKRAAKGLETLPSNQRVFDPLRSAGVLGTAGGISSLIEGGGDDAGAETPKVITKTSPAVTPPPVSTATPKPEGESYADRRSRFARAAAKGGISKFGEAMTEIETKEREQELEAQKVQLESQYRTSIVDARSYNSAVQNLLNYNKELTRLISADAMVMQAEENLRIALAAKGGKGKGVAEARRVYDAARKKAMADIGNTVSGGSLLANISALNAAIEGFRGGKKTTEGGRSTEDQALLDKYK